MCVKFQVQANICSRDIGSNRVKRGQKLSYFEIFSRTSLTISFMCVCGGGDNGGGGGGVCLCVYVGD